MKRKRGELTFTPESNLALRYSSHEKIDDFNKSSLDFISNKISDSYPVLGEFLLKESCRLTFVSNRPRLLCSKNLW